MSNKAQTKTNRHNSKKYTGPKNTRRIYQLLFANEVIRTKNKMSVSAVTVAAIAAFLSGSGLLCVVSSSSEYALYRNAQNISEVMMA